MVKNISRFSGRIIQGAEVLVQQLITTGECPRERCSGYFTVRRKNDGRVLLISQIGNCPEDKALRYLSLSQEKGWRLFQNHFHASSWQTRDETNDKFGGAIVAGNFIISFSGLPELADEALVLYLAIGCDWITEERAMQIACISNNIVYQKLILKYPLP